MNPAGVHFPKGLRTEEEAEDKTTAATNWRMGGGGPIAKTTKELEVLWRTNREKKETRCFLEKKQKRG